jgi:hypothetical protein
MIYIYLIIFLLLVIIVLLAVVIRLLKKAQARTVVYAYRLFETLAATLSKEAFAGKAIVQWSDAASFELVDSDSGDLVHFRFKDGTLKVKWHIHKPTGSLTFRRCRRCRSG